MQRIFWILAVVLVFSKTVHAGAVLDKIKQRDTVRCGVNLALAGFSIADSRGIWTGLDVEYCKALAAAVLGDATKVQYIPLGAQQRFTALQSGEVDVLARNTTWTLSRDAGLGIQFVGVIFYDGQGMLVRRDLNVTSVQELDGASICFQSGTTTELNLADYFRARTLNFTPVVFEGFDESVAAFLNGRCDAYTGDVSSLAVIRTVNAKNPDDLVIVPQVISKEPLAPAVAKGDQEWFTVARWALYALLEAEEKGLTQANVDQARKGSDPAVQRLLGVTPGIGRDIGLADGWVYAVIRQVGNYGEIYDRTLGSGSSLKLERSFNNNINQPWTKGGLMYAPPLR
jgi:general L-amino acid transport system substrate-binding protein